MTYETLRLRLWRRITHYRAVLFGRSLVHSVDEAMIYQAFMHR